MSSKNYILYLLKTKNYDGLNKLTKTQIDAFHQKLHFETSLLILACSFADLNSINIILSKLEYSDIKYMDYNGNTALKQACLNTFNYSEDLINILLFYYDKNNTDDFEYLKSIKTMSITPKINKKIIDDYLNTTDYVLK